ncbi:MAG: hypothetical protein ACOX27_07450 [Caldicoprobacterales bacterium]
MIYAITNSLKNVKGISLAEKTGYSLLDIPSKYPGIENIDYTIIEYNGRYSLKYNIYQQGRNVESQIMLNNINDADPGTGSNLIWVLYNDAASLLPSLSIRSPSELIKEGVINVLTSIRVNSDRVGIGSLSFWPE